MNKKTISKKIYKWSRVLHIYLSTSLFALMILFCVTGIVLNHMNWISGSSRDGELDAALPKPLLEKLSGVSEKQIFIAPPLNEVQGWLAQEYSLAPVSTIELDDAVGEIIFDYQIPGGYAAVIWYVSEGRATINFRKGSYWAVIADLHKGRHSGIAWAWVIDISAALMVLFSITGMIILVQNNKHRRLGLWCMALGAVTPFVIYLIWVPTISGV